jgi:hypothetical protein
LQVDCKWCAIPRKKVGCDSCRRAKLECIGDDPCTRCKALGKKFCTEKKKASCSLCRRQHKKCSGRFFCEKMDEPKKAKIVACDCCRSRKQKCDGQSPCSRCISHGKHCSRSRVNRILV